MKQKYKLWIEDFLRNNDPQRKCKEAVDTMHIKFPELTKVRGHVISVLSDDPQPHWWLIDSNR